MKRSVISRVALMLILVLLNRFACPVTFFAVLSSTVLVNLSGALLLVQIMTLLFIGGVALLFRNILTLLLRYSVYLRHLDGMAHLLIHCGDMGLLNSGAVFPWLIPTLLF